MSRPTDKHDLRQRQIELLKEVNRILVAPGSLPQVLDAILATFEPLCGKHIAVVFLLDENTQELYGVAARGYRVRDAVGARLKVGKEGVIGLAAAQAEPLYVPDTRQTPEYLRSTEGGEPMLSEFAVPLKAHERLIGVLNVESTELDGFPAELRELLTSLADPLAIAITTAQAQQLAQSHAQRMSLLAEVNRVLLTSGNLPEVLDAILTAFERLYGKHHVGIFLFDPASQELYAVAARGVSVEQVYARRFRLGIDGIIGRVAASAQPIYVPDSHVDPNYIHILTDAGEELRSEFAIPLLARGNLVGVFNVESTVPDGFPREIRELLLALADSLAIAIGTARGHELARTRAQRLEALARLTAQLGAGDNVAAVLHTIHACCRELLGVPAMHTWLLEPDGTTLRLQHPHAYGESEYTLQVGQGPVGRAVATGEPFICHDLPAEQPDLVYRALDEQLGWRSYAVVPLCYGSQRLGALSIFGPEPRRFSPEDVRLLAAFANHAAVALVKTQLITERERLLCEMEERVKELTCMYQVANAVQTRPTLAEIFQDVVTLIPSGWQYPEITRAKIYFDGQEYISELFQETPWKQASDIVVGGEKRGSIEVYYVEERPQLAEGPFLKEERTLIDGLAYTLSLAAERKQAEEALKRSKEFSETILNSMGDAISIIDPRDRRIIEVNRAFLEQVGLDKEQVIGRTCYEITHHRPQPCTGAEHLCPLLDTLKTGTYSMAEHVHYRADGQKIYVDVCTAPIKDETGEVRQVVHVSRDITERKRLQLRLAESERLAAIGRLIAGVAHELNNPLQSMVGFSELLLRERSLAAAQRRFAERIQQESQRAKQIVTNLLTFARQYPLEKATTDLNALLQQLLEMRAYSLRMNEISVETLFRTLPRVVCDAHRLQQAFLNLLLNAEQALEKVSGPRHLFVSSEAGQSAQGAVVRVLIRDTGCGIPREDLSRIFDPFFTTKDTGEGTGLGLSIAYAIIKEHGGTIELSSERGQGTSVTVTLPIGTASEATAEEVLPDTSALPEPNPDPARRYVLVIDDEEHICDFLVECLGQEGLWVDTATTSSQGLARLRQQSYDLVLCDIKMPGKSGIQLYQEITKEQPELAARFVFITGDALSAGTREFLDASGCHFLLKPFSIESVLELVAKLT